MAVRVPSQSEPRALAAVIEIGRFCDISRAPFRQALPSKSVTERASRASEVGLGCVRGTTLALLFEAVTALGGYGIWRLFQLCQ